MILVRLLDDNVELYEGGSFWWVNPNTYLIIERNNAKKDWMFLDTHKYFSTEDAAKTWVTLNEKKYSLQDIIDKLK